MNALAPVERAIANVEAEIGLIAAMLCEPRAVDQIADRLDPTDFADPFLGFVYGTIIREYSLGRALNPVTIRPFLEAEQAFADLGGMGWLADLGAQAVSLLAARGNADQIRELSQRRRLIEGLKATIAAASDYEQSVEKLIAQADEAVSAARDGDDGRGEHSAADCVSAVIGGLGKPIVGVTCGNILSVDRLLGPLRPKHLIIGAGRPGMGKTATAVSYSLGAAARGHGVLFVSLEMGADEIGERMAADLCLDQRILYERIRDRDLTPEQSMSLCRARDRLADMPLQVVDKAGMTVSQLRRIVKRWRRRFEARGKRLELVIVDYLQLMRAERNMDRYAHVTEVSQSLKEIAKDNELAVFALAQLSRAVEQRADKRPILADLRDSGQIEQDADSVLFFLRDEYYLRNEEPPEGDPKREAWQARLDKCLGRVEFICAKRRAGRTGSLMGEFLYHYQAVRG